MLLKEDNLSEFNAMVLVTEAATDPLVEDMEVTVEDMEVIVEETAMDMVVAARSTTNVLHHRLFQATPSTLVTFSSISPQQTSRESLPSSAQSRLPHSHQMLDN